MSMKNRYAHLADGTRVRVKHTPFPISFIPIGTREGDVLEAYDWKPFKPYRPARQIFRRYIVRMGGDGRLWLVRLRRSEWR